MKLVNAERAKAGLAALQEDWELSRVAKYKSQDMHDKITLTIQVQRMVHLYNDEKLRYYV